MTSAIEGGAARPWGVEQTCPELEVVAPEEAVDPVVDGLTADLERLSDLLGGEPLGEPEHRLARHRCLAEGVRSTRSSRSPRRRALKMIGAIAPPPLDPWCLDDRFYLSKNFASGPDP